MIAVVLALFGTALALLSLARLAEAHRRVRARNLDTGRHRRDVERELERLRFAAAMAMLAEVCRASNGLQDGHVR